MRKLKYSFYLELEKKKILTSYEVIFKYSR